MRPFGSPDTNTPKAMAHRAAANAVNSPKHKLMEIAERLRNAGANRKAEALTNIIRRLEDWQR